MPRYSAHGRTLRITAIRDITERKLAQDALRESEQRFRSLVELTSDWVWATDNNGVYIYSSPKVKDLLGYNPEEIIGKTPFDLMAPDEAFRVREQFSKLVNSRQAIVRLENTNLHKDGSRVILETSGVPIIDSTNIVVGYRGIDRDITERKEAEEALQKSQALLARAQKVANLGSWEWDINTGKLVWSDQVFRLFGLNVGQIEPSVDLFIRLIDAKDRPQVRMAIENAISGRPYNIEFRATLPDSSVRYMLTQADVDFDAKSRPTRMIGTVLDITELKLAQIQLDQARAQAEQKAAQLHAMIETIADPAIFYDAQGSVIKANAAAKKAFGFDPTLMDADEYNQLPYKLHICYLDGKPMPFSQLPSRRALRGEAVVQQEVIFTNLNGRKYIVENSTMPLIQNGKVIGVVAIWHDITDRKHAENALQESEQRFRTLAEAIPAIVWTADPDGKIDFYNKRWYEYSGLPEGTIEFDARKIIHPDDWQTTVEIWKSAVRDEKPYNIEHRLRRFDGRYFWHLSRGLPLRDDRGRVIKWFGMAMDIHDQKRTLEEIARLKAELEGKNAELESIISIASHDLRSPLVNIKGFAGEIVKDIASCKQLLAGTGLPDEINKTLETVFTKNVPEAIGFIQKSSEAINLMLISLMQVAKAGMLPLDLQHIDMNAIFEKIAANFQFKLNRIGAVLEIEQLPPCQADITQVTQIFSNLVDNAIKYHDPARPCRIRVYASEKKKMIEYCVEDNSKGISPENQEKIFDMFYRLSPEGIKGEGLGLTISKRMLERQKGKIRVESEIAKGSKFFVSLPK